MFKEIGDKYDLIWKAIIRPPRAVYDKQSLGTRASHLGPTVFRKKGMKVQRTDVELTNKRGYKLVGSHYEPYIKPCRQLPCVIYLHGNSSCQLEAYPPLNPANTASAPSFAMTAPSSRLTFRAAACRRASSSHWGTTNGRMSM